MKMSLVLLCGLSAAAAMRPRRAAMRPSVRAAAILCAAAMPPVELVVPPVHIALPPALLGRTVEPLTLFIPVHATEPLEDLQAAGAARSGFAWRVTAERILRG